MAETKEQQAKRLAIHPSHQTQEHPVRGLFCRACKVWSGDESRTLGNECPGPRDFTKEK